MARRARGSNQYRTKLASDLPVRESTLDLLEQAVQHQLGINEIRQRAKECDPWQTPAQPFRCSDTAMHALMRDPNWRVRAYAVYCCEEPPEQWWSTWSQHKDHIVRAACAYRPDCPEFLRFMLARDNHHAVRASVAMRSGQNPAIARRLAEDDHPAVRAAAVTAASRS